MLNEEGRLELTPPIWKLMQQVQKEGNKVKWTPDDETWGVVEKWTFPKEMGDKLIEDCDGITLWKMRALLQKGIPADCLLFTVCHTETGGGHAILCVITDRGDFILDNRHREIKAYNELRDMGYEFLYRSKPGHGMTWLWDRVE